MHGTTWTQVTQDLPFTARVWHSAVSYESQMWVLCGFVTGSVITNEVNSSSDGATWDRLTTDNVAGKRYLHASVAFNAGGGEKMWMIGGYKSLGGRKNEVLYSSDGSDWTLVSPSGTVFSSRDAHTAVVLNGTVYVIGGFTDSGATKDVWSSTNMAAWTQNTASAAFGNRYGHSSVPFDNKLWVIGGSDGPNKYNDVWYSSDGASWTQATAEAAFSKRNWHRSFVYDNKIWVIAGTDTEARNDVWFSADGAHWIRATEHAAFPVREGHGAIVYNNKMWVFGGQFGTGVQRNDVWWSN